MQRQKLSPRPNWQSIVEQQGLTFHTPDPTPGEPVDGRPYWDESACYEFTAAQVDQLEAAANELQTMCLAAAQNVIDNQRYAELEIPAEAVPLIEWAWNQEPPALYGRFDVLYDGSSPPKLLEYNADTPTSLLEAAVIQWYWLQDVFPAADQFNSLHEKLIAKWKDIDSYLEKPIYFASADNPEDLLTVAYLRDTAQQAGLPTQQLLMQDIGWNEARHSFVDASPEELPIQSIFKLYPWESMLAEEFGQHALATYQAVRWIEPIWKLLLSNKGLLPILWDLYPGHELLLEAHFDVPRAMNSYVKKPLLSREGANITLFRDHAKILETDGPYGGGRFVFQELAPPSVFPSATGDSRYPTLGLWMIDQECCGMGVRESASPITGNLSSFVPHYFRTA